jgi:hypothetical protein
MPPCPFAANVLMTSLPRDERKRLSSVFMSIVTFDIPLSLGSHARLSPRPRAPNAHDVLAEP